MAENTVTLTEAEAYALSCFIATYIKKEFEAQDCADEDALYYLANIFSAFKKCQEATSDG